MASWLTPAALFVLLNIVIGVIAVISIFGTQKKRHDHHHQQPQHGAEMPPPLVRSPSLFSRVTSFNFSHLHRFGEPAGPGDYSTGPAVLPVDENQARPTLDRAPSLLARLTSLNFSHLHRFEEQAGPADYSTRPAVPPVDENQAPPTLNRTPSLLERLTSFDFSHFQRSFHSEPVPSSSSTKAPSGEEMSIREGGGGGGRGGGKRAEDDFVARDHHVTRTKSEPKNKAAVKPAEMRKSASEKLMEQESEIGAPKRPATERERVGGGTASFGNHDEEVDAKADDFINRFKQQLKLQRLESLLRYRNVNAAAAQ